MFHFNKIIPGLVLISSIVSHTWAENSAMDLKACFQAALNRSEVLADQAEQIAQAEEHYRQAWGNIYPNLYGYASYFQQQNSDHLPTSSPASQQLIKIGLNQPLFRGFREYAAVRQNRDVITAVKAAKQWAGMQLYIEVAQSFYAVLAAQNDLLHLDTQTGLYEKRIQDLNARVRIGRSRPSEVLTVQAAQAGLKAQRQQVAGQLGVAREMLAFLTGMSPDLAVTDREPEPAVLETLDTYLACLPARPDVLTARKQIEVVRANLDLAKGGHWPSLDLYGNYYLNRTGSSLTNVDWDAQVALTLPIFTGGFTVSKVAEAESQVRQSELTLSRIERTAQEGIRDAYKTFLSDQAQVAALQEAVTLSEKNYQAVLKDYNYGLVTNLEVLQALSSYQDSLRALDRLKFSLSTDYQHLLAVTAKISF